MKVPPLGGAGDFKGGISRGGQGTFFGLFVQAKPPPRPPHQLLQGSRHKSVRRDTNAPCPPTARQHVTDDMAFLQMHVTISVTL